MNLYECNNNPACTLGSAGSPGNFTSGITPEAKNALTGDPVEKMVEGKDHGEGVCPNCGKKGKKVGTHKSVGGKG